MSKAVALYSGGLDSTLAIIVMAKRGVEIEAVHFDTDLAPANDSSEFAKRLQADSDRFGFRHTTIHLGRKFLDIVQNPHHGYGKNMNPCIDCKILMIREAGEYMRKCGADFLITGEVVGQRPMSQMKPTIMKIDKASGMAGYIVRPLSGKILEPTIPEQSGLIQRDWLLAINGRSRKGQIQLAEQYGLTDYATPAGGCFLTDSNYAARIKDLFIYNLQFDQNDIFLLRHGRHFRLSPNARLVVGRDENDNDRIAAYIKPDDYVLEVADAGSPLGVMRGNVQPEDIELAAAIMAGYSSAKYSDSAVVEIKAKEVTERIKVVPAPQAVIQKYLL